MNNLKICAVAGLIALAAPSAIAQEWLKGGSLDGQGSVSAPTGIKSETGSGFAFGPAGLSPYTFNEASVSLGAGISVGTFSAFSGSNATTFSSPYDRWTGMNAIGGLGTGPGAALNTAPGSAAYLNTSGPSSVGGKLSMDLGSGLSMNFVGGVTRDNSSQFYLGPHGALDMSPGGATSSTLGAGLSMDLGGGQSFGISGTVTRSNVGGAAIGPCGGMAISLCR